jgi:predicted RNA-binding Zn ribbon-like protein
MNEQVTEAGEAEFEFSGGALCLDFANTAGSLPREAQDRLNGYEGLLRWAGQASVVGQADGTALARLARSKPEAARRSYRRAMELREAIFGIFSALAAGGRPESPDLETLNAEMGRALPHLRIASVGDGFEWTWTGMTSNLDGCLWPVVRSAADLLASDEVGLVRECGSETCSWLFVDRSRTHRRRWCDMKTCGNRAKARRHYRRTKARRTRG